MEDNDKYLHEILFFVSQEHFLNYELVRHLLQRLKDLHYMEVEESDALKLSSNIKSLEIMDYRNKRFLGMIYESK